MNAKISPGTRKPRFRSVKLLPYQNPRLSPDKRARDLLARMTLEEKAAQMICIWRDRPKAMLDDDGNFDPKKARAYYKKGNGLGQVSRPSDAGKGKNARETAELTNQIQKFFLENSRLKIPVAFHEECLHGHWAIDSTHFPQPIALASTFDPQLVERLFTMTAEEARVRGAHHVLTPVVDVVRDPRWGRCEETYGEDPYLVSRMGIAAVRGFQGDGTFRDRKHVMATLKHFTGHGQPESGMNCAPANISERVLREAFFFPFKEVIKKAGAVSVMASYNEIDGVPSHANKWLLRDILRKEMGFKGFIISDYWALWELSYKPDTHGHFVAQDKKESAKLAVEAGVNLEAPDPDIYLNLVELVKKKVLKEKQLDDLVYPLLYWKIAFGLFEDPYVDPNEADRIVGCAANREPALEAARASITLLKNENNLAPLNLSKYKTIAVIGPNADRSLLGGYSGVPRYNVSVLQGIRERIGDRAKVLYSEGCKITIGGSWGEDQVVPGDPEEDRKQIAEAVTVAKQSDVIVLAIGGNEQTSREAYARNHMGDRTSLELIGRQEDLVKAMLATGKPVIVFLFHGRPLSINHISQNVPVIYDCFYLGQETGYAVADVLLGHHNPGGKLPISVPRSVGHLPAFYNYKPSARRGYLFDEVSPLYPFGYGLSYTTFKIGEPKLAKKQIKIKESTKVSVSVKNTGERAGTETIQLYIRDAVSSVTRPVKELKGFQKVSLKPGESTTVTLEITPDSLAFYDINMNYTVEPGDFEIMVGNSSRDEDLQKAMLTVK
jgi:beta-glucosidase